uniref:Uncharacterized protein n=1 Tax=Brassica oleracea TaxID=3712 RepID=A0A3P6DMW6_BRAOL|nr:unnamed protein product [Brassica oleracea]
MNRTPYSISSETSSVCWTRSALTRFSSLAMTGEPSSRGGCV